MTVASIAIATILPPRADVWWPSTWPPVLQWLLALLIFDLSVTLVHAASHRWSGLWRFHAVHHGAQRLYGLNGLARHPVHQVIETIGGSVPLMVLGMPPWVGAMLALSVAVQLLMQHGNVDYRLGALARWLSCNRAHRLHHRADADGDVNFGLFLLLWDRLLGTYRWEDSEPAHDARLLGVADRPDFPVAYWDQLIDPFRARQPATARPPLDSGRSVGETSA
jgi:sterol desaturase/sphingolipid hydroxylase (fatty acid hydroxylase superfamily)